MEGLFLVHIPGVARITTPMVGLLAPQDGRVGSRHLIMIRVLSFAARRMEGLFLFVVWCAYTSLAEIVGGSLPGSAGASPASFVGVAL